MFVLGYQTFLNGTLVSTIAIDTSAAATDTIDYVAIDGAGNTATSTRTITEDSPSIVPTTALSPTLVRHNSAPDCRDLNPLAVSSCRLPFPTGD
jgi:hypothetical protein